MPSGLKDSPLSAGVPQVSQHRSYGSAEQWLLAGSDGSELAQVCIQRCCCLVLPQAATP